MRILREGDTVSFYGIVCAVSMAICALLTEALSVFLYREWGLTEVDIRWEFPFQDYGDTATPLAFHLAKRLRQSPVAIAERLACEVQKCRGVERCDVAGAGYVNVWFTSSFLIEELGVVHQVCSPLPLHCDRAPVIIDYSSPNIAKPLGIHHILSTIIGQTLGNLYVHAGYPVVRWNYIGDWGTQYGKLAVAYERWGGRRLPESFTLDELLALYVRFHEEAERDVSLESSAQEAFKKLESGDPKLRLIWEAFVAITKHANDQVYQRLRVHFDVGLGESAYEGKIGSILDEGKRKGVFREGERGALIIDFFQENLPTAVVLKSDGSTVYFTRDLALMRDRIDRWHPSAILHVVDSAQSLYFQQLFATARQLQWEVPHLEHVVFGRMRFADVEMSTRKGTILKLEHVLDEAVDRAGSVIDQHRDTIQTDDRNALAEMMGTGALVYGILSQNRKMDIIFDWDRFLSFDGNSAPYFQYTYARARSVLRKAGGEGAIANVASLTPTERSLVVQLLQFPSVLQESRDDRMPHKLCQYLYQLCQAYNAFYNVDPILTATSSVRDMRLFFTSCTASVLRTGAGLLTLQVPDRM